MNQDSKIASTSGYATGTTCTKTSSYRASNNYMESIIVVSAGETFPPFVDGRKTIWRPLGAEASTTSSFNSVKVAAGTK